MLQLETYSSIFTIEDYGELRITSQDDEEKFSANTASFSLNKTNIPLIINELQSLLKKLENS